MSTIMKALRRVEGERQQKTETDRLHGEVTGAGLSGSSPLPRPRIWLGIGLGVLLLAGLGLGLRGWQSSSPSASALTPTADAVAPLAAPRRPATLDLTPPEAWAGGEANGSLAGAPHARPGDRAARPQTPPAQAALPSATQPSAPADGTAQNAQAPPRKNVNAAIKRHLKRRNSTIAGVPPPPTYVPPPTFDPDKPIERLALPVVRKPAASAKPGEPYSPYLASRKSAQRRVVHPKPFGSPPPWPPPVIPWAYRCFAPYGIPRRASELPTCRPWWTEPRWSFTKERSGASCEWARSDSPAWSSRRAIRRSRARSARRLSGADGIVRGSPPRQRRQAVDLRPTAGGQW